MKKTIILIDEMNGMAQFYSLKIQGLRKWSDFVNVVKKRFAKKGNLVECHFYCSNVPKDLYEVRYSKRERFFSYLRKDGIHVHKGTTVIDQKGFCVEKQVDVLIALDLVEFSKDENVDEIFLFSGDCDLNPAIERAKSNGVDVNVIVSPSMGNGKVVQAASNVISLKYLIGWLSSDQLKIMEAV